MRSAIFLFFAAIAVTGLASASTIQTELTADELRKELKGVYLEGVAALTDETWSECIDPAGKTIYSYQGVQLYGQLDIRESGLACFEYGERVSEYQNCFRVVRQTNGGYIFSGGSQNGGQFKTLSVRRNIKSCPAGPEAIS